MDVTELEENLFAASDAKVRLFEFELQINVIVGILIKFVSIIANKYSIRISVIGLSLKDQF